MELFYSEHHRHLSGIGGIVVVSAEPKRPTDAIQPPNVPAMCCP
nr:MAG TPA: hypothetical protein [Caudoviricetes sp.]